MNERTRKCARVVIWMVMFLMLVVIVKGFQYQRRVETITTELEAAHDGFEVTRLERRYADGNEVFDAYGVDESGIEVQLEEAWVEP